jgi:hypothetical protein
MMGTIGAIQFESNGNLIGAIEVFQYQSVFKGAHKSYEAVKVGSSANAGGNTSVLNMAMLDWTIFSGKNNTSLEAKPESSCGRQCAPGEYAAQLAVVCCWECKPCPENGDVSNKVFNIAAPKVYCSNKKIYTERTNTVFIVKHIYNFIFHSLMLPCHIINRHRHLDAADMSVCM